MTKTILIFQPITLNATCIAYKFVLPETEEIMEKFWSYKLANKRTFEKMRIISYMLLVEWLFSMFGFSIGVIIVAINHLFDIQIVRTDSSLIKHVLSDNLPVALDFFIFIFYISIAYLYFISLTIVFVFIYCFYICLFQVLFVNEYIKEFISIYTQSYTRLEISYDKEFQREMYKQMKFMAENIWIYAR